MGCDAGVDGVVPLEVRLLAQKAISSPLQVPPTTKVTLKPARKPGPIFEARRAAICIFLLTSYRLELVLSVCSLWNGIVGDIV